jgi:hypothetical protein
MNPSLLMEKWPRCDAEARAENTAHPSAKSLRHNAFSIRYNGRVRGDRSLSALSYALTSRRTQLVVVEEVRTRCWAPFNAHSDSQITNFNILVGWEIGIAHLRTPGIGERHG